MVAVERIEALGIHEGGKVLVPHFLDLSASGADQVSVGQGDAFILRLHPLKDVTSQHLGLHQQFNRVIHGRTAHVKTVPLDELLQLLDSEVTADVHHALQDGIAFGRSAHPMSIKILIEFAHNGIVAGNKVFNIRVGFHLCDKSTTFFAIKQRILWLLDSFPHVFISEGRKASARQSIGTLHRW